MTTGIEGIAVEILTPTAKIRIQITILIKVAIITIITTITGVIITIIKVILIEEEVCNKIKDKDRDTIGEIITWEEVEEEAIVKETIRTIKMTTTTTTTTTETTTTTVITTIMTDNQITIETDLTVGVTDLRGD